MLKNYLKIAYRNLTRNLGFTALNLSGLVIGMAGAIIILLWIQRELSVDRFHENGKHIYKVYNRDTVDGDIWCWYSTPKVMGPALAAEFPEVIDMTRMAENYDVIFNYGEKKLSKEATFADSTVLNMFSFDLLQGDKSNVLNDPSGIVLTEEFAQALFGSEDPLHKTIRVENRVDLKVTGVMKNLPANTDFNFEALIPYSAFRQLGWHDESWGNNSITTYVQLHENTDISAFNNKIKNFREKYVDNNTTEIFLHGLEDQYLYSRFENGKAVGGNIELVRMFSVIAIVILLIACINFMNLSTARSEKRAKEVGIRKLSGAGKQMLVGQFITESIILSLISGLIALTLVQLVLPLFNDIINVKLTIPFSEPVFWVALLGFIVLTGLLAGSYPAFFLSSFQPVKVLKGSMVNGKSVFSLRKILVVTQFTFAIILIASTIIIYNQIDHAQNREKHYDQSQLIYVILNEEIDKGFQSFREELMQNKLAVSVLKTMSPVTQSWSNSWGISWEGKDEDSRQLIHRFAADVQPVKAFGFTLLEGRDLDVGQFATDSFAVILNKEAVKIMGFEEPIGQIIKDNNTDYQVIGVVENFLNGSPFAKNKPMAIFGPSTWMGVFHIKLNHGVVVNENLKDIAAVFSTHYPTLPFDYQFIDEYFAKSFTSHVRFGKLATIFSLLAIIISCLGLFGLSAYAAEKRNKEIGVRKVLGASVLSIVTLLSSDFLKLVAFSILIGTPLTWFLMNEWLSDFDYRISISASVFIITALMAVGIALLTVSFTAFRTANINPVNSLKDE